MQIVEHYPYYWRLARSIPAVLMDRLTGRSCAGFEHVRPYFEGRIGMEFGGPSSIFSAKRLLPVYSIAQRVDYFNFSEHTIWTSRNKEANASYGARKCTVAEASSPASVCDASYDFVLASHVLEHLANPLQALLEWKRILHSGGVVLIVVPNKSDTFDHRRPFSTFEHIKEDYRNSVTEDDLTHLPEVLELHDLAMDPGAGTKKQFRDRCFNNASIRAMHHHVFSPQLLGQMFAFAGMDVLNFAIERPYHIIVCARTAQRSLRLDEPETHVS
jgi:SAM-dependent methyltransferase